MIFDENITFGPLVIQDDDESETKSSRDADADRGNEMLSGIGDELLKKQGPEATSSAKKVLVSTSASCSPTLIINSISEEIINHNL